MPCKVYKIGEKARTKKLMGEMSRFVQKKKSNRESKYK